MDQKDRSVIRAHATVDQSATNFAGDARRFYQKDTAIAVAQRMFHHGDETIGADDEQLD
ncbi:MAG: hypothetical protein ABTR92_14565 [Candidatus Accumulibacter phosphatis]